MARPLNKNTIPADEMGIAQNALILMFIREGLKGYKESDSLNK